MHHSIRYSSEFKAKVALAALSESKALAEFASEYKLHPSQYSLILLNIHQIAGIILPNNWH